MARGERLRCVPVHARAVPWGEADDVDSGFLAAQQGFRDLGTPFELAMALLENGEWLIAQGQTGDAEPLLDEARGIFDRLSARPWLERLAGMATAQSVP